MRPLLLLDIDGVLMPLGRSLPRGFERREIAGAQIVVSDSHSQWLAELLERFDLVWATTWAGNANPTFGVALGLPELPHVELGALPREGTRKLAAIKEFVGSRPAAWLDDEIYDDAHVWADQREVATLLLRTRGAVGMTRTEVGALISFADALSG
jgi:hypothetical protein